MGKKATKAADNIYYQMRTEAAKNTKAFSSREGASEVLGIDRTRLANIELENIIPYPEEVQLMAKAYNAPELCNEYCAHQCAIGKGNVAPVVIDDFDRLSLKVLGSLKNIDELRASLIAISEDGIVDVGEEEAFEEILNALDKIANNAAALKLWAKKNIRLE